MIFLGVMAKAILDSLSSEFEALLESDIGKKVLDKKVREVVIEYIPTNDLKICTNCQTKNGVNAKYCSECWKQLP